MDVWGTNAENVLPRLCTSLKTHSILSALACTCAALLVYNLHVVNHSLLKHILPTLPPLTSSTGTFTITTSKGIHYVGNKHVHKQKAILMDNLIQSGTYL